MATSTKPTKLALLQAIWRKALRDGRVEITLPTAKEAQRTRMELYNAVKLYKRDGLLDPELTQAAEGCGISFQDDRTLVIAHKTAEDWMLGMAESLGIQTLGLAEAPKTRAEAEFKQGQATGGFDRLMKIQAEADARREDKAAGRMPTGIARTAARRPEAEPEPVAKPILSPEEAWARKHEEGQAIPYAAPDDKPLPDPRMDHRLPSYLQRKEPK